MDQQRYSEAEPILITTLQTYYKLAANAPAVYLSDVAMTLNNLGALYERTQRFKEAEEAFQKVTEAYSQLVKQWDKANPPAHVPLKYVAGLLASTNNLGVLYARTQRFKEAEEAFQKGLGGFYLVAQENSAVITLLGDKIIPVLINLGNLYRETQRPNEAEEVYKEVLTIRRQQAETNNAYLPDVAMTLTNLGLLYSKIHLPEKAEEVFKEGLAIYRQLAQTNPGVYLPEIGLSLNKLASLAFEQDNLEQAQKWVEEALSTHRALWNNKPKVHGDNLSLSLVMKALIQFRTETDATGGCEQLREALRVSYTGGLKQTIQKIMIKESCNQLSRE